MHKDCMITLVNFGLCFPLLFLVMEAQNVGYLLVVFLIMWTIVGLGITGHYTENAFSFSPWVAVLVATGVMLDL